ncbi:Sulfate transporter CysZ [Gigaspora margarita]|uniref:Sulfate transporter CysZ n=1 Tax=Gigaspora margarita TaxID=4874 RepID=A0A8H4AMW4_GIGMA|nr:Sulfate transporter CysZ [Gigaspora margarita]
MALPISYYPIEGIFYFFSHWILIRRITCILFITLIATVVAFGLSFGFLLSLQAHALIVAGCPAWLAWIVSVIFCLLEAIIFTLIFYLIATPIWQDALFDDVLRLKGLDYVLERQRNISETTLCCRGVHSGLTITCFQIYALIILQVLTLLLTIPLHALPIIGTILYCYINGWIMTWGHQLHYHLEIKEFNVKQSIRFALRNHDDYVMFGMVAVALELIPIANFIFFWTNVVGAALWTADVIIEEQRDASRRLVNPHGLIVNEGGSNYAAQRMNNHVYGATFV